MWLQNQRQQKQMLEFLGHRKKDFSCLFFFQHPKRIGPYFQSSFRGLQPTGFRAFFFWLKSSGKGLLMGTWWIQRMIRLD